NFKKITADAIAVGVGIDRNMAYARESGFDASEHGIRVNEYLETNYPEVYAAGDVAEFYDVISRKHRVVGNWTSAVLQGKRAGLNMMGMREPFSSVPSYSITNLGFQITALGDISNHADAVVRMDKAHRQYERFFFEENVLAGAVLINRFADKAHLAKLIEQHTDMSQWREQMSNNSFDIHTIPVVV
ncbi:MAG: FAD-dependent oxidoreductase, partial [Candidatus Sungbacteria bacterium]|nr:FAD-dependent oxidoreductase [Candidatus Sungbacteria bacterium]